MHSSPPSRPEALPSNSRRGGRPMVGRPRTQSGERLGIQTLGTGLNMLKLVSEHGAEMALSSVARRTATTPSKAHRYIVSLVEHGMLRQSDVIGLYDLGPAAAAVGFRALNRFDSTLMLQEAMSWLALRTGFPTCFYVWTLTGPDLAAIGARCRRHDAGTQAWSNGAAHRIPHRRRFLAYLRPNSSRQCWRQSASGMRPTSSRSPQQRRSRTKWIL